MKTFTAKELQDQLVNVRAKRDAVSAESEKAMPPDTKQRLPAVAITERPTTSPREPVSMATNEMNDSVWVETRVEEDRQRNGAGKTK